MHLLEDLAIIEVVDRDNRPMAPGVFGDKLLVTVLGSRTQPLIRYELEDGIRLAESPCPCGRPFRLIDAVRGRVEETLSFPSLAGGVVVIHPVAFANIMDALPLSGWQIVQDSDGIHVRVLEPGGSLDAGRLAEAVRGVLAEQGAAETRVVVQIVPVIPQTTAGKTPLVLSSLPHRDLSPVR
jgi:phenylacetate-coenzyme A ligase PaaK-like adenylate-forming protein